MVNSARMNHLATIDDANMTVRSALIDGNPSLINTKEYETTYDSCGREMQGSLLWKPRPKSESKKIRVSNQNAMNNELLGIKLGMQ